jgi:hypothetical protein
MASGGGSREQLKAAADATHAAGRQVAAALRHARKLWAEMQPSGPPGEPGVGVPGSPAGSGDWPFSGEFPFSGQGATSRDPASRQQWREVQREQVQRWRESQRAQTEELKASAKAFQQESRESARRMKENLKAAHRVHQEELRNARHADKEPPH